MASIANAAPQLLVDDLAASLAFYEQGLGFSRDFVHEDFYASVSRDGDSVSIRMMSGLISSMRAISSIAEGRTAAT